MWKYKRSEVTRHNTAAHWAEMSDEDRNVIGERISIAQKARMSKITDPAERRAITEQARAAIDREKQGAAASAGLKRYWAELRKDPVRYQEYINNRRIQQKAAFERKQHANL